jgi:hypothetical protein
LRRLGQDTSPAAAQHCLPSATLHVRARISHNLHVNGDLGNAHIRSIAWCLLALMGVPHLGGRQRSSSKH